MNRTAEQHLSRARDFVARGEEFYRKAAEEILAAQKADPTLSNREIGEWFGRSEAWVRQIVSWLTSSQGTTLPFSEPPGAVAKRHARSVLRDPDQVADLIDSGGMIRLLFKWLSLLGFLHAVRKGPAALARREARRRAHRIVRRSI